MNEKIKQLAMQAGTIEQTGPELWSDNQVEKFAELIVRECAAALIKEAIINHDDGTPTYDILIEMSAQLQRQFGVK